MNMVKAGTLLPSRAAPARFVVVRAEAPAQAAHINKTIKKEEAKVVDVCVATAQEQKQVPYCRCWKSSTFPLCDATHAQHNKETGDNVGPLLVKKE
ncbi:hypothetical protein DUNSADRAFT_15071 [Dunaliella salina]|uniref:Iron-binding zinc finger CDGSH type domain-containing protein n=1 Tax=Dunaliella salina TaxID=3046 RepID=A0ABQ7G633_DUNSA|nr:hypothetical protein DUNSADRAFT_15071 [Dunaliella salina]|eukprot:KAF5830071.1 hypothetical protein DUNSADRAFT_15071 [Dunaliella salina]